MDDHRFHIDDTHILFGRRVCPRCVTHPQLDTEVVNRLYREGKGECDCKNEFYNDEGETIGQCCCYAEIHLEED